MVFSVNDGNAHNNHLAGQFLVPVKHKHFQVNDNDDDAPLTAVFLLFTPMGERIFITSTNFAQVEI